MKRINLIKKPKQYQKYENLFLLIRRLSFIILLLFLFIISFLFFIIDKKNKELQDLTQKKKELLIFLNKNKEKQISLLKLKEKNQLLIDFLKNDVNFLPYYDLLLESLKSASESPKVDKVTINNKRKIEFYLSFNDVNSFLSFLKYAESDFFIDKFNKLYISKIDLSNKKLKKESEDTKILFIGEFKESLDL